MLMMLLMLLLMVVVVEMMMKCNGSNLVREQNQRQSRDHLAAVLGFPPPPTQFLSPAFPWLSPQIFPISL
jgi:hypothetical protein